MKNYHDFEKVYIGISDIGTVITVGMGEKGLKTDSISFGSDGVYTAYFVNEEIEIPTHYRLEQEFAYWLKIYDDQKCQLYIRAAKGKTIKIYRAGMFGCLIYAPGAEIKEVY